MPIREKALHLDVFALYMEMGGLSQEFVAEVGRKFGKSDRTLRRWEKELGWKERAKQPIQEAVKELEESGKLDAKELVSGFLDLCKTRTQKIGSRATYLEAIFAKSFDRIPSDDNPNPENPIVIETLEDMERVTRMQMMMERSEQAWAKLSLVLVGEPDSHTQHSGSVNITQAIMDGNYYEES